MWSLGKTSCDHPAVLVVLAEVVRPGLHHHWAMTSYFSCPPPTPLSPLHPCPSPPGQPAPPLTLATSSLPLWRARLGTPQQQQQQGGGGGEAQRAGGGAAEGRGPKGTVRAVTSRPGRKGHSFGTVVTSITELMVFKQGLLYT